jgi:hypothetical protein
MRFPVCLIVLATAGHAFATEVPKEFLGYWVPQSASCQSGLRFRVEPSSVILQNGERKRTFGDLDVCYSCEGGAAYSGQVVWLVPEFNSNDLPPFTAYFNAGEKSGVTKLNIQEVEIQKAFPLHDLALKRCK